jgi:hypothetical protein
MKKYFFALIAIMSFLILKAQQDIVIKGSKQISEKYTPQQILDSLHKNFPNAKAVKYYKTSDAAKKGWAVTEETTPGHSTEDVTEYTISFKQHNFQYYGLYDEFGNVLKYKFQQTVDEVPEAVKNAAMNLKSQYPGYKATSKTYFKTQDYSKTQEYYEVTASNGTVTKKFYFAPDGKVIKVKN